MAGLGKQRQPIALIQAKGKKHLTNAEIEERKSTEVNVDKYKKVEAPNYLTKKQKDEFKKISDKLVDIGIMSELDEDILARYLIAKDNYIHFTKLLKKTLKDDKATITDIKDCAKLQDEALKQCNTCAERLGLTITSRCRLQVPQAPTKPKDNKFSKFLSKEA